MGEKGHSIECNGPTEHLSLFISLITDLITTDISNGQGVNRRPEGQRSMHIIGYNMDY